MGFAILIVADRLVVLVFPEHSRFVLLHQREATSAIKPCKNTAERKHTQRHSQLLLLHVDAAGGSARGEGGTKAAVRSFGVLREDLTLAELHFGDAAEQVRLEPERERLLGLLQGLDAVGDVEIEDGLLPELLNPPCRVPEAAERPFPAEQVVAEEHREWARVSR